MKNIFLFLVFIPLISFGQEKNYVASSTQTFSFENNQLDVFHTIQFNLGSGGGCPEYAYYSFNESNNQVFLNIAYSVIGTWQSFFCERKDTFSLQLPDGTYDLSVCVDIIDVNINTQIVDTTNFSCDFYPNNILGINEILFLENAILIYPNPVSSSLSISTNNDIQLQEIKFLDLQGREIKISTNDDSTIDVSQLTSGNYFIEVKTSKGILRKKIVVE